MIDAFSVADGVLLIAHPFELGDREAVAAFRGMIVQLAEASEAAIVIDFRASEMLSSAIITASFIAFSALEQAKIERKISLIAPFDHHRSLVAAGLNRYVDLQLCG